MNSTDTQQAETSKLVVHAERELDLMGDDSEPGQWMKQAVMSLIRVFANGGHSGFSAPYCIETFKRLAQYEPLTPLTGDDDEWIEVTDGLWQNKRCSRVFKNAEGEAWDVYGKVFREPDGYSYTNGESRTPVTFPYVPKTVYVDESDKPERSAEFLEKALEQAMETNLQLRTIEAPCVLNGVSRDHIGQECIVFGGYYPGEILGWASEYPELAEWLRAWLGAGDAKKE